MPYRNLTVRGGPVTQRDGRRAGAPRWRGARQTGAMIGHLLRQRRIDLELTQDEIAHEFGVNQSTWARWENGTVEPPQRHVGALSAFLRLPAAEVWHLTYTEAPPLDVGALRAQLADLRDELDEIRAAVTAASSPRPSSPSTSASCASPTVP